MDETENTPLLEAQNGQSTQVGSFWARNITLRRSTIGLMVSLVVALCLFTIISNWNGAVQPECYIEKLHALALDKTSNQTPIINDTPIFFNLVFKNQNMFGKIYYETVNITFHRYGSSLPIGKISIPKFVVENKASVLLNRLHWEDAHGIDVTNGSTEMFGITLDTEFRSSSWYSDSPKAKIYRMRSQANVMVNDQGTSVKDKVWLSTQLGSSTVTTLLWILVIVLVIIPLSIQFCLICVGCCVGCCV